MVHYFLHKLSSQSKAQKFQKTTTLFIMFFSNLHSTTLESIKHKQYLISKQKHSKISLYLIMLPRQLLHTHSTNFTHTCTNWLKGCDNYIQTKTDYYFCTNAEIALLNLEIQRTSCWLRLWHTLSTVRLGSVHIWRQIFM